VEVDEVPPRRRHQRRQPLENQRYAPPVLRALTLLLLLGAPPKAQKADALAKAKHWEDLYLAFAAADPKGYSDAEKKSVGTALEHGCEALAKTDAVMAYSLAEKAAQFDPTADALLCLGRSGVKTQQKSSAEQAFKQGEGAFPDDGRFPLELGKLALSEKDSRSAVAALERVPKKSRQAKEADALLKKARALRSDQDSALEEAAAQTRDLHKQEDAAAQGGRPPPPPAPMPGSPGKTQVQTTDSLSYESAVDSEGRRVRQNAHFRFRYFNGQKDFGQRADYEGSVQAALEKARTASRRVLGETRDSPTDVILYSKEEFELHHGKGMAAAIAGFYSDNAIRMNDSAEMNEKNQATLVHEYTHAVIDELSGFHDERLPTWINEGLAEWTEWHYQGNDDGPPEVQAGLKKYAQAKALPSLEGMSRGALAQQPNPALRYATSASAIGLLVKRGGMENVIGFIRDVGGGANAEQTLKDRFGKGMADLDEELQSELADQ
jgi:hypothetical protein